MAITKSFFEEKKHKFASTASAETYVIGADAKSVALGKNVAGDTVAIEGFAGDFKIKAGSNGKVTLVSYVTAPNGKLVADQTISMTLARPTTGTTSVNLQFLDGAVALTRNTDGSVKLGTAGVNGTLSFINDALVSGAGSAALISEATDPAQQQGTYTISSADTVDEGNTILFTLTTTGVAPGSKLAYTLTGAGITAGDIDGPMSGTVEVNSLGLAVIEVKIAADNVTDVAEKLKLSIVGTDAEKEVTINDTSVNQTTFDLTAGTDRITGTSGNDHFDAFLSQNMMGGVSNSLSSADFIDGGAGNDTLHAELVVEFLGGLPNDYEIDVQPRTTSVENVQIEARDWLVPDTDQSGRPVPGDSAWDITVDAKKMFGVEKIGSSYSDGDLVIENLTTLASDGVTKRNTSEMTITMDHTDNTNTDGDASDLHVYFDDNYLLSGQTRESQAFFFLLDEDADLVDNPNRLERINVDGIRFSLDGGATVIDLDDVSAQTAGTHAGFVAALQSKLAALIAAGTVPEGTTLTLDPTITDSTFLDDGSQSAPIPAIVLTIGDGTPVTPLGYSQVADAIGQYDVYGRFSSESEVIPEDISVNVELTKVGRGGDGGDLIIGAKSQAQGIPVMNVTVKGDDSLPNSLNRLMTTAGDLTTVNIKSDSDSDSYASLEIRGVSGGGASGANSPFGQNSLEMVNANEFYGDLTLGGTNSRVMNLETLSATGGGDIGFFGELDGTIVDTAFSYTTGAGNDTVDLLIDGDAADFANSSVLITTAGGDDEITVKTEMSSAQGNAENGNEILNQAILGNFRIDAGDGNDTVLLATGTQGNFIINGGAGDDFIRTSDTAVKPSWVFNVDATRFALEAPNLDDLPGKPLSLSFIGGAKLTVTLSGAGLYNGTVDGFPAGGGVMAGEHNSGAADAVSHSFANGATGFVNGYESTVTIDVAGPNSYFGTQADINAAIMKAINDDPILGKLLEASISSNNTLVVTALVDGAFAATDLDINIQQQTAGGIATSVLSEARAVFQNSALTMTGLWGAESPAATATFINSAVGTDPNADTYFDGINSQNIVGSGSASTQETDNVIDGGAGNDLIVLSTYAQTIVPTVLFGDSAAGTYGLQNGASNETIKLTGSFFGHDTIMNFTDSLVETGSVSGFSDGADFVSGARPHETGVDFLDFTAYLTNTYDRSTNSETAPDSNVSNILVPVSLNSGTALVANEVEVITLQGFETAVGTDQDWATLESTFLTALQTTGGYTVGSYGATLVETTQKVIFMIENDDSADSNDTALTLNDGHYKVFEVTMSNGSGTATDGATGFLSATYLGSLDFGTTLSLTNVNLVGSADHAALLTNGFDFGGVAIG